MKILFFVGEFNEGGAERVISILANELVERGFDIEILKYHNTINFYKTNDLIKINSVEENTNTRKNIIKNILWLHKYFKNNTDIVISFLAPFNMVAIASNIGNKTPIIVADRNDPHTVPSNSIIRFFRNQLYKLANGIVLQTNDNKNYFSKTVQKKSRVIYNPINIKERSGIAIGSEKENIIVSVARLEKQKNQELLIRSFYSLKDEFKDYKLVIYGEGSYRKELEVLINNLGINDRVFLPGNTEDIINKIKKAKVFVLSSNYEGMSNSLIEAMYIGLPVISTKVSGANELINNNENGLLIDINNQNELISSLKEILLNKELRDKLAKNACNISYKLNVGNIVNEWVEFINTVK